MKIQRIIFLIIIFFVAVALLNFLKFNKKEDTEIVYKKISKGTIVIDPGHGGEDSGSISQRGVNEKDVVFKISSKLRDELMKNNFEVYLTREWDKSLGNTVKNDIINRAKIINESKADIFLSIHLNASDIKSVKGVETYSKFLDDKSYLLAESIQDELSSVEYTKDRGIKQTDQINLGILRRTNVTGVLLELGFITNIEDEKFLISEEGQAIIINCILNGILNYFNQIRS